MSQPTPGGGDASRILEAARLRRIYENLRLRLLDLTRRNQLLNYGLSPRSKRFLQAIDCNLETVHRRLAGEEGTLRISPLPEPDDVPTEERTEEFGAALERARATDVEYQSAIEAMEVSGQVNEAELEKLDRWLKDRLREQLGLPLRPTRKEINRVEHARSMGIDPSLSLSPSGGNCSDDVLQTLKFPDELKAVLEKISGDAHLAEQEMGLSTLFLAFGFLEWYESETSEKKAFAPLLLLPVQIDKQKLRGKPVFSITLREGGAEANLSLQKLLEQNFSRKLPDFQSDDDDEIGSVETYFEDVTATIEGLKRWQIRRWLVLGHFSFGRFAMYADLEPQKWGEPAERKLVGSLLRGSDQQDEGAPLPGIPDDYPIDQPEVEGLAPFLIQDADASQHSALIDVMKGENLVIQGPPGTGKSQTITNIIANALAHGKTVLFLAEKQAALEVVKRRLDRSGLGDFCLELHSGKVSPKTVIASVKERYELGTGLESPSAILRNDPIWRQTREEISSYLRVLHKPEQDGSTAFGLIWQAVHGRSVYPDLADCFKSVRLASDLLKDSGQISLVSSDLEVLAGIAQDFANSFGHPGQSPWARVVLGDFPPYDAPRLVKALTVFRELELAAQQMMSRLANLGVSNEQDIDALVRLDATLGKVPDTGVVAVLLDLDLVDLESALVAQVDLIGIEAELSTVDGLRYRDPEQLAIAASLMQTKIGTALSDMPPVVAYKRAAEDASTLQAIIDAAKGALSALAALGIDSSATSSHLPTAATAGHILATSHEQYWQWIVGLSNLEEASIVNAKRRSQELLLAEKSWRQRLKGYHPEARPSPDELDGFAATLRKVGLTKAIAVLTGATKIAREYCLSLGIDASANELETLGAHIRAMRDFESDRLLASQFGSAWNGLGTPFEEIYRAIKVREFLKEIVQPLPGGSSIVERASRLTVADIESLHGSALALKCVVDLESAARDKLDNTPLGRCLTSLESRVADLQHFLSVDPNRSIANFEAPIRLIAYAHQLLGRKNITLSVLEAHPTARHASELGSDRSRVDHVRAAIGWIRTVRALSPTENIESLLLTEAAFGARELMRSVAREWADIGTGRATAVDALTEFGVQSIVSRPPSEFLPLIDELLARSEELSNFVVLRQLRRRLESAGLNEFLKAGDVNSVEPRRMPGMFAALVAEGRAGEARRVEGLAFNNGAILEARRRTFAERDLAKIKNDRLSIRAELLRPVPPTGSQYGPRKTWTDMRLLANEFPKVKRFTPVRQVVARAGAALQTLKPCFMMSPLSLAKFVAPGQLEFDLLVIDEASQMRPEDALGGMLRAKQIVVVGDAKQLPPTDFFSRAGSQDRDTGEREDEDDDIDAESILDACEISFGKRRRLRWHYRSRCESLIAFSNNAFYDDTLITFPMAKPGSFSVQLVRVDGTYRNRRNPAEAAKIAEEAITFMRHFAETLEEELPTLGIVAINTEQREFIQEELGRLWLDDRLVEMYLAKAKAKGEPFFVKNLENVQGDERDHIFISMTYGRKHGEPVVGQTFGPINRKQGHRRLNVLFTRARVRIGLFTSFGSADVRPTEGSSDGVRALKRYLEYTETRGRAFIRGIGGEADSDFEDAVATRLRLKGYEVDLQVGVSGFRIDLGVRHPDHPEHFLAGVECDGAAYHSSKSARDRDRLREDVLRSLGWNIVRVWSTDWFDNPDLETEKLVRKLEDLRAKPAPRPQAYPSLLEAEDQSCIRADKFGVGTAGAEHRGDSNEGSRRTGIENADPPLIGHAATIAAPNPLEGPSPESRYSPPVAPLTPQEAIAALESFRETVIRPATADWVAQHSILRPAMIETFVSQRISDPGDWFDRIPQYLRTGTNPEEKRSFLESICEIVDCIDDASPALSLSDDRPKGNGHSVAMPESAPSPAPGLSTYTTADPTSVGSPDRDRFFDRAHAATLKNMIAHVIAVEGPIFEDVLVDRIARAHGLMRSGSQIRRRVVSLLQPTVSRVNEGGRNVIWPAGKHPGKVHPYRKDPTGARTHDDVPAEEIAAIAYPFIRLRMDDEAVLRKIAEEFSLGRLREATRSRFDLAMQIAMRSL